MTTPSVSSGAKRSWVIFAGKTLAGMGIDREGGLVAHRDTADVGFVDVDLQLHPRQVFGQGEQDRRVQRGGDDLALFGGAVQHDAGDRAADLGLGQVALRLGQAGFGQRKVGAGDFDRRNGTVVRGLGGDHGGTHGQATGVQLLGRCPGLGGFRGGGLGLGQPGAGGGKLGLDSADAGAQRGVVKPGEDLADRDLVVEIHLNGGDACRTVRTRCRRGWWAEPCRWQ